MPMRWTLNLFNLSSEATRSIKSVGVKASIVVIGAVIAAGSIHRATCPMRRWWSG
jgi:hypothetical protein